MNTARLRGAPAHAKEVEAFGPYQLVVRPSDGSYHAVLWRVEAGKPAERLVSLTAGTSEEAKAKVETSFYESRLSQADAAPDVPPEADVVRAWMYIWPHLNEGQRKMIRAQYHAPQRRMTTLQLADAAGYHGHGGVNLWYGKAGLMMFGELPRPIEERSQWGNPIFSFALSTGVDKSVAIDSKHWTWEMRPELARGLEAAGLVRSA